MRGTASLLLQSSFNDKIIALEKDKAEIRQLKEYIFICFYCKSIWDDIGKWYELVHYITGHTGAKLNQGICPDCMVIRMKAGLEAMKKK